MSFKGTCQSAMDLATFPSLMEFLVLLSEKGEHSTLQISEKNDKFFLLLVSGGSSDRKH